MGDDREHRGGDGPPSDDPDEPTGSFDVSDLLAVEVAARGEWADDDRSRDEQGAWRVEPHEPELHRDQTPTMPPPVSPTDYVAQMMESIEEAGPIDPFGVDMEPVPDTRPFPGMPEERTVIAVDGPPRAPQRSEGNGPTTDRGMSGKFELSRDDFVGRLRRAEDRFAHGDYGAALLLAEAVAEEKPHDAAAQQLIHACKRELRAMYMARIGESDQVPRLAMKSADLKWLQIDHRAGFVLSRIDGQTSIDEILDLCGMPSLEALRILYEFLISGVIELSRG